MNQLSEKLSIQYPFFMAPMFLVSNLEMIKAGMQSGVMAIFPSLNYLDDTVLDEDIKQLKAYKKSSKGNFGVNLIIKGNPKYEAHLDIIVKNKVPLVVTSLGNPSQVIERVHAYGGFVFCDVTNIKYAQKSEAADGFVAVGNRAGGHAGTLNLADLVPKLKQNFPSKMIVAAGGIVNKASCRAALEWGADAVSVGTPFIVAYESQVSQEYKNAIIKAGEEDIVLSPILSGTPSTILKTDYFLELEKELKDKDLNMARGISLLKASGKSADYKKIFVAGPSVEYIEKEQSVADIVRQIWLG